MQCAKIHNRLRQAETLSPMERAHITSCEPCTTLSEDDATLATALKSAEYAALDTSWQSLLTAVESDIAQESRWTRLSSLRSRTRVVLGAAATVLTVLAIFATMRRIDFSVYPTVRMLATLVSFSALLGVGLSTLLRSLGQPRATRSLWLGAGFLLPVLVGLLPLAHSSHPASLEGLGEAMWPRAMACLAFGVATALPAALAVWLLDRTKHTLKAQAWWAAAAAGLTGNLVLQVHCPIVHTQHLLLGHATVGAVLLVPLAGVAWFYTRRR